MTHIPLSKLVELHILYKLDFHDTDALDNMVRVADHINEMKRISDMYYSVFEAMLRESELTEVRMFMLCNLCIVKLTAPFLY